MKFIEVFHRARFNQHPELNETQPNSKKDLLSGGNIPITFTTFNTSTYVANEMSKSKEESRLAESYIGRRISGLDSLTKETKLTTVATVMLHPTAGLTVKDRRWHLRLYENVFIGNECVDWLLRMFCDINTRDEAVEFGNMLLQNGFFEHVNRNHQFLDGHYFYRLNKEYVVRDSREEKGPMRWFRTTTIKSAEKSESQDSLTSLFPEKQSASPSVLTSTESITTIDSGAFRVPPPSIMLSRKLMIDLDPQRRSYRREVAILHYDTVHNPKNCYHFHLHWLVCTARLVEDMLQSWGRIADKFGLKLIEAPIEQTQEDAGHGNPFQSPIEIKLAISPPVIDRSKLTNASIKIPEAYFEVELLKHFHFILDIESDDRFPGEGVMYSFSRPRYAHTQYVHRSGAAFVQIRMPEKRLFWINNRLLSSRHPITGKSASMASFGNTWSAVNPDTLRRQLEAFCSSSTTELSKFWSETANKLLAKGLGAILDDVVDDVAKTDQCLIVNRDTAQYGGN
jgi:hypothetical protein